MFEKAVQPGTSFEWVFTGPRGGFTVVLGSGSARIEERYYDSFGLVKEGAATARYPERLVSRQDVKFAEALQSVTVEMNSRLQLAVLVNHREVYRARCLIDVQRSQLSLRETKQAGGVITGYLQQPAPGEAEVSVAPRETHQTILGFGGITSIPAYRMLSHPGKKRWWDLLKEYNLLLHREYPNGAHLKPDFSNFTLLEDASPHYYGDNFPNGEISDWDYLRRLRQIGGRVLFEFWELPPWAMDGSKTRRDSSGRLRPGAAVPDRFVDAVLAYCRASERRSGAPPEIVGIQNEVLQDDPVWTGMVLGLRSALDRAGFTFSRLHMPDAPTLEAGIRSANALRQTAPVWNALDFGATHEYDFQRFFEHPDDFDARMDEWRKALGKKPFMGTEFAVNDPAWQAPSYRIALAMAQLYQKNLTRMDAVALLYCWLLLDVEQPSFAGSRALFVPDREHDFVPAPSGYQLRVFGAFSQKLEAGMKRVGAVSNNPDVLPVVCRGAKKKFVIVLVNRSSKAQRVKFKGLRMPLFHVERTNPYNSRKSRDVTDSLLVGPGEIVTLWNHSNALP